MTWRGVWRKNTASEARRERDKTRERCGGRCAGSQGARWGTLFLFTFSPAALHRQGRQKGATKERRKHGKRRTKPARGVTEDVRTRKGARWGALFLFAFLPAASHRQGRQKAQEKNVESTARGGQNPRKARRKMCGRARGAVMCSFFFMFSPVASHRQGRQKGAIIEATNEWREARQSLRECDKRFGETRQGPRQNVLHSSLHEQKAAKCGFCEVNAPPLCTKIAIVSRETLFALRDCEDGAA